MGFLFNPDCLNMKKIILSATLLVSVATFAQKEELKTLKKIYAKENLAAKDLETYKTASDVLQNIATEESDKVYAKFYKTMYPTLELAAKGSKATMLDQMQLFNDHAFIKEYGAAIDETIEFEKKSGKKIYTDELIAERAEFKQGVSTLAMSLNEASRFKEASDAFYSLYLFDPKNEGKSLQNAAIVAVQSNDYKLSQKLYEEFYNSDYFNNGISYFATNIATGSEEDLGSKTERTKLVSLGLYEKSRDERVNKSKPQIIKILAILYAYNNDLPKAKAAYSEARLLAPEDQELKTGECNLYLNEAYAGLEGQVKLVEEINASRDNKTKFDKLMAERKDMFQKVITLFEKAYSIDPTNQDTKNILKTSYEITGQPEKAKAIN